MDKNKINFAHFFATDSTGYTDCQGKNLHNLSNLWQKINLPSYFLNSKKKIPFNRTGFDL
jgi:hypothetical protein